MGTPDPSSSFLRFQVKPQCCWERDVEVLNLLFVSIHPHSPPDFLEMVRGDIASAGAKRRCHPKGMACPVLEQIPASGACPGSAPAGLWHQQDTWPWDGTPGNTDPRPCCPQTHSGRVSWLQHRSSIPHSHWDAQLVPPAWHCLGSPPRAAALFLCRVAVLLHLFLNTVPAARTKCPWSREGNYGRLWTSPTCCPCQGIFAVLEVAPWGQPLS